MKILIVITSGIGNVIMLSPTIKALHETYKNPEITLLSSSHRKEGKILEGWKYLKNCVYNTDSIFPSDFDKILISPMYGSEYNQFINSIHRSKVMTLNCFRQYDYNREHEVEVNMRYPYSVGFKDHIPSTEVVTLKPKKAPRFSRKKAIVGIHAGCLNHPDYKRKLWLKSRWNKLSDYLVDKGNCQVVWFGSGKDYSVKYAKYQVDLVNKYDDIKETAYVIKKCDYFISLDSSMMHCANALGVPTVALFGPTHPSKNRPWNPTYKIIQSRECKECYISGRFFSCRNNKCMKEITPEEVYDGLIKLAKEVTKK